MLPQSMHACLALWGAAVAVAAAGAALAPACFFHARRSGSPCSSFALHIAMRRQAARVLCTASRSGLQGRWWTVDACAAQTTGLEALAKRIVRAKGQPHRPTQGAEKTLAISQQGGRHLLAPLAWFNMVQIKYSVILAFNSGF